MGPEVGLNEAGYLAGQIGQTLGSGKFTKFAMVLQKSIVLGAVLGAFRDRVGTLWEVALRPILGHVFWDPGVIPEVP